MSPEDRQLAAAAAEEVRHRLQEAEDKLQASKQDSCREHHLDQLTRTSAAAAKQPAQSTIERRFLRKDRAAVDSLFAEFMFSSSMPSAIAESPLRHKFLAAVGRYGSSKPPNRRKLAGVLLDEAFHACMHA